MHVRLFNVRSRQASQRNTITTNRDPYAILASLDSEFDSFGEGDCTAHMEHVAPGLFAHDGVDGCPVLERRAA